MPVLKAELGHREMNHTTFVGHEPIPPHQGIDGGHGEGEAYIILEQILSVLSWRNDNT